jgi:hypothetical protein
VVIQSPNRSDFVCIFKLTKECNELNPFEKHKPEHKIIAVETSFDMKEVISTYPVTEGKPKSPTSGSSKTVKKTRGRPPRTQAPVESVAVPQRTARERVVSTNKTPLLYFNYTNHAPSDLTPTPSFSPMTTSSACSPKPWRPWSDSATTDEVEAAEDAEAMFYRAASPTLQDFNGDGGFLFADFPEKNEAETPPATAKPLPSDFTWVADANEILVIEEV